jgi:uncharacterized protein
MNVISEIYVLPDSGQYILYAPLKRVLLRVNASVVGLLQAVRQGRELPDTAETAQVVDRLRAVGVIDADESYPPDHSADGDFRPTRVTLLPTSDCNLRCIYCYADSGTTSQLMSLDVAKAAVDLICANAKDKDIHEVPVGFLGGGEPFLAWEFVQQVLAYTRTETKRLGLAPYFTAVTNGMLTEAQVRWIIENFQYLNVSLDGDRAIQDQHRPTRDGHGSYGTVEKTVRLLSEADFKFAIRATVSSLSVGRLVPIIEWFTGELGVKRIQLEPLFACGRCRSNSQLAPAPDAFVENFKACIAVAHAAGAEVLCSGIRMDTLSSTFCGALTDNFYVTPAGYVTSCTEVSSPTEALADVFFIGRYDPDASGFVFWEERRRFLAKRSVLNMNGCGGCIAKWHCAGGCAAKAAHSGNIFDATPLDTCRIARDLTEHSIRGAAEGTLNLHGITVKPYS